MFFVKRQGVNWIHLLQDMDKGWVLVKCNELFFGVCGIGTSHDFLWRAAAEDDLCSVKFFKHQQLTAQTNSDNTDTGEFQTKGFTCRCLVFLKRFYSLVQNFWSQCLRMLMQNMTEILMTASSDWAPETKEYALLDWAPACVSYEWHWPHIKTNQL